MTMPTDGPGAWMLIEDVFHIKGRGTVATGRLEGTAPVSVGDVLVCEGASWKIIGLEVFRAQLTTAQPGTNIGILLKDAPAGDMLAGRSVTFAPAGAPVASQPPRKRPWFR